MVVSSAAILNVVSLAVTVIWLLCDGYLERITPFIRNPLDTAPLAESELQLRLLASWTLVGLFWFSWLIVLVGANVYSARHRSLKWLFWLVATVAVWTAVQLQWDRFIEWGRVHRHRLATAALIDYAREVDRNWDQIVAGNSTLVSPYFNAYPLDKPTLLLLATEQPIPQTSHRVIAIERSGDRTIRFELSRGDRGYWLEVRQASAGQPQSYVGGLEEQQKLVGWRSLGEQAFLVRYAMD